MKLALRSAATTFAMLILSAAACVQAAAPPAAVAVLNFDVAAGGVEGATWADLLTVRLSQRATVVDRTQLQKILAEQRLSATGFTAPETAVQVGKLLGAKTLLAAGMYEIGNRRVVALRAVDVETGRARGKTISTSVHDPQTAVIDRLAEVVVESLPTWQAEAVPDETPERGHVDLTKPAIAVLYFDPVGPADPEWSWLSTALGDLTINLLASQHTRVISRDNMQARLRNLATLNPGRDLQKTLEIVKAQRAVHGVYQVSGGRVTLRASLVEAASGRPLHTATVEGPIGELLALHRRATAEIIDVVEGRRAGTLNPARLPSWNNDVDAARTLYRGVELFDRGRYLDAWMLFRRAGQMAPNYPDAVYWSARMMYYVQEYHQARHDLIRFLVSWSDHPRAGDAGLEIIHTTQSVGSSEAEVIETLGMVAALAPQAEVANFERKGEPTFLAYYADALTAQLHYSRRHFRAAADALGRHLDVVTRDDEQYAYAWSRMYDLRLRHFNETGEWWELPLPPIYTDAKTNARSAGGKHPIMRESQGFNSVLYSGEQSADQRSLRPIHWLTPNDSKRSFEFRDDPLVIGGGVIGEGRYAGKPTFMSTYLNYVAAPPGYYVESVSVDVEAEEIDQSFEYLMLHGAGGGNRGEQLQMLSKPIPDPNHIHFEFVPPPNSWIVGVAPKIQQRGYKEESKPHGRVVGWKMEAKFTPIPKEPTATIIVRQASESPVHLTALLQPYNARLEGFKPNMQPGEYRVKVYKTETANRDIYPTKPLPTFTLPVEPNTISEVQVDDRGTEIYNSTRAYWYFDGSTDLHRFTDSQRAGMGRFGDGRTYDFAAVSFCRDRNDRLIAVWSVQRDVYLSISADNGRTWGECRMLSTPVNSAHIERNPCLHHDADGRYVLIFNSDRSVDRNLAMYACWSVDLEEFSAPVRITVGKTAYPQKLLQRSDGTYLLYAAIGAFLQDSGPPRAHTGDGWGVYQSTDLVTWSKPVLIGARDPAADFLDDGDGFLVAESQRGPSYKGGSFGPLQTFVRLWKSDDGVHFTTADRFMFQEVPPLTATLRRQAYGVRKLTLQRSGDKLYLYGGGFEGKIFRRDGTTWTEVLDMPRDFGCDSRHAICLLGEDGFLRVSEGGVQWLPVQSSHAGPVEYAAVPKISASRFGINLRQPEPQKAVSELVGPEGNCKVRIHVTQFKPGKP